VLRMHFLYFGTSVKDMSVLVAEVLYIRLF